MGLFELFWFFFRISAVTFGGGIVILGMVKLEEEKRRDIDPDELDDMISLAVSMPGPMAVSIAWLFGRRQKGLAGSIVSVLGAITPPFFIILFISPFVIKYSHLPEVRGLFKGVLCGTCAIIATVVFGNVKKTVLASYCNILPIAAIIAMIGLFEIHPLISMVTVFAVQYAAEKAVMNR
jgi:chromate transporter